MKPGLKSFELVCQEKGNKTINVIFAKSFINKSNFEILEVVAPWFGDLSILV